MCQSCDEKRSRFVAFENKGIVFIGALRTADGRTVSSLRDEDEMSPP
jgi:hypothetical protein